MLVKTVLGYLYMPDTATMNRWERVDAIGYAIGLHATALVIDLMDGVGQNLSLAADERKEISSRVLSAIQNMAHPNVSWADPRQDMWPSGCERCRIKFNVSAYDAMTSDTQPCGCRVGDIEPIVTSDGCRNAQART